MLAALCLLIGCAEPGPSDPVSEARQAIRNGLVDLETDAVVMTYRAGSFCSGVVVSEDVVLTAAHCFASDLALGCRAHYPPIADEARHETRVVAADALDEEGAALEIAEIIGLEGADALCGHDLVALRLAHPTRIPPMTPRLDVPPRVGERVSVVGFGNADPGDEATLGERRRRDDARVTRVGGRGGLRGAYALGEGDFAVDAGACRGDSGGPALDEGGRVIGVMSRGDARACVDVAYTRLDRHARWLRRVVTLAARARGADPPAWAVEAPPAVDRGHDGAASAEIEPDAPRISPSASTCAASPRAPSPRAPSPRVAAISGALVALALRRRVSTRSALRAT